MNKKGVLVAISFLMPCLVTPALAAEEGASDARARAEKVKIDPPTKDQIEQSKERALIVRPIGQPRDDAKPPLKKKAVKKPVKRPAKTSIKTGKPVKSEAKKPSKKAERPIKKVTPVKKAVRKKPVKAKRPTSKKTTKKARVKNSTGPSKVRPVVVEKKSKNDSMIKKAAFTKQDQIIAAWLNKNGNNPSYRDGEKLAVTVAAKQDCNVMIFNYDGAVLTQLFPNSYQTDPLVKAGCTVQIGGDSSHFDFEASNDEKKPSSEKIFVYAYPVAEKPITLVMNTIPSSPFRSTSMKLEEYRKLVNESVVFNARKVKVVPKKGIKKASYSTSPAAPNKVELSLTIKGR